MLAALPRMRVLSSASVVMFSTAAGAGPVTPPPTTGATKSPPVSIVSSPSSSPPRPGSRDELAERVRKLCTATCDATLEFNIGPEWRETAAAAYRGLDAPLRIAFVGEFNTGKSSLLKALFLSDGVKLASENAQETTQAVRVYAYGPTYKETTQANGSIRVEVPVSWLRELNTELVDTPGLGSPKKAMTKVIAQAALSADLTVFVTDRSRCLNHESEHEFVSNILAGKHVAVVVNHMDRSTSEEKDRVINMVRANLCSLRPPHISEPKVIPASARLALSSLQGGQAEKATAEKEWEDSCLSDVKALAQVGSNPLIRSEFKFETTLTTCDRVLSRLSSLLEKEEAALSTAAADLARHLTRVEDAQSAMSKALAGEVEESIRVAIPGLKTRISAAYKDLSVFEVLVSSDSRIVASRVLKAVGDSPLKAINSKLGFVLGQLAATATDEALDIKSEVELLAGLPSMMDYPRSHAAAKKLHLEAGLFAGAEPPDENIFDVIIRNATDKHFDVSRLEKSLVNTLPQIRMETLGAGLASAAAVAYMSEWYVGLLAFSLGQWVYGSLRLGRAKRGVIARMSGLEDSLSSSLRKAVEEEVVRIISPQKNFISVCRSACAEQLVKFGVVRAHIHSLRQELTSLQTVISPTFVPPQDSIFDNIKFEPQEGRLRPQAVDPAILEANRVFTEASLKRASETSAVVDGSRDLLTVMREERAEAKAASAVEKTVRPPRDLPKPPVDWNAKVPSLVSDGALNKSGEAEEPLPRSSRVRG